MQPPEIQPGLDVWYDDFYRLSRDRQLGMATGPIPHGSILRHIKGWPDDDAEMFYACIEAMDEAYRAYDPKKTVSEEDPKAAFERMFGGV